MITTSSLNRLRIFLMAVLLSNCVSVSAQNVAKTNPEPSLPEILKAEASDYKIALQDKSKSVLTMYPEPVLAWVNPVRYQQQGFVYVWTHEGKARAVGGVFSNYFSEDRYRLWDNRKFTPEEIKQLLKNAKSKSVETLKQ